MTTSVVIADVPVLFIIAKSLPEAWEKAVLAVWDNGFEVKTQYDKAGNPPSKRNREKGGRSTFPSQRGHCPP